MNHGSIQGMVLSLAGLDVGYGNKVVLENVSFRLGPGSFLSLLGPNGAGKTTLLRTISGFNPTLGGSIRIAGKDFGSLVQADLARLQAVVLTDRLNPGMLTAYEVVPWVGIPIQAFSEGLAKDHRVWSRAIEMVGAGDLSDRLFEKLSDGEKKKYAGPGSGPGTAHNFLDEPTSTWISSTAWKSCLFCGTLCREMNVAVIASLHDIDIASRVSDQVAFISGGSLSRFRTPELILDDRPLCLHFTGWLEPIMTACWA
jgi:iron complex transport system ATP-binding protein